MQTSGAFARGFWKGVCSPVFFFDAIGVGGPRPISSRYLATDWNGVIDSILGRSTRRRRPGSASSSERWLEGVPSAQSLEELERVFPGGADRILKLMEQERAQRINRRRLNLEFIHKESTQGLWMGFALVTLSIAAAATTALMGCPWQVPVSFVSVPLLCVVRAFVSRRVNG